MKQRLWSLPECIHCIGVKQADFAACTYDIINIQSMKQKGVSPGKGDEKYVVLYMQEKCCGNICKQNY